MIPIIEIETQPMPDTYTIKPMPPVDAEFVLAHQVKRAVRKATANRSFASVFGDPTPVRVDRITDDLIRSHLIRLNTVTIKRAWINANLTSDDFKTKQFVETRTADGEIVIFVAVDCRLNTTIIGRLGMVSCVVETYPAQGEQS